MFQVELDIVALIVAIVAAVGVVLTYFNTVKNLKVKVDEMEQEIRDSRLEIKKLEEKRTGDILDFTKVLAALNTTVGKLDYTIAGLGDMLKEMKEAIKDHDKEIKEISKLKA